MPVNPISPHSPASVDRLALEVTGVRGSRSSTYQPGYTPSSETGPSDLYALCCHCSCFDAEASGTYPTPMSCFTEE